MQCSWIVQRIYDVLFLAVQDLFLGLKIENEFDTMLVQKLYYVRIHAQFLPYPGQTQEIRCDQQKG